MPSMSKCSAPTATWTGKKRIGPKTKHKRSTMRFQIRGSVFPWSMAIAFPPAVITLCAKWVAKERDLVRSTMHVCLAVVMTALSSSRANQNKERERGAERGNLEMQASARERERDGVGQEKERERERERAPKKTGEEMQ